MRAGETAEADAAAEVAAPAEGAGADVAAPAAALAAELKASAMHTASAAAGIDRPDPGEEVMVWPLCGAAHPGVKRRRIAGKRSRNPNEAPWRCIEPTAQTR
jgi:hypothetical protein